MENDFKYLSSKKAVKSGSLLEVYQFGKSIMLSRRIRRLKTEDDTSESQENKLKSSPEEIQKGLSQKSKKINQKANNG